MRRGAASAWLGMCVATSVMVSGPALAKEWRPSYRTVLTKVAGMVDDPQVIDFARVRGLDVVNVMWEDTGRYYGSSVGPNISDVTIQVQHKQKSGRVETFLMPVIRSPNFSDKTGDVAIDKVELLVGNEQGEPLRAVTLKELLGDLRTYLHAPGSWKGTQTSLLAPRDSHVLVSAQAAFLPIPKDGEATFNPVIFNYQSTRSDPAVLTILATREGTSITVIDNARDGFDAGGAWGQRLFFNHDGQRASLTGKRESEVAQIVGNPSVALGGESGMNMVMLIQVPLKQRARPRRSYALGAGSSAPAKDSSGGGRSDVENAVIGHGALEGPFVEIDDLAIERDPRFPVRVTVQFYKATSNGVVSRSDIKSIQAQIKRVYKDADYVGSLVTEGFSGRPTEWDGDHTQPAHWWADFWNRYETESGMTREQALVWMQTLMPGFVSGHELWSVQRDPLSWLPFETPVE